MTQVSFRTLNLDEVPNMHSMESQSYPDDEAASYDMLVYRQTEAPGLQLGCYLNGNMIGFVCATRYHGKTLTHESMGMHIPSGGSVCIHSVVVKKDHRRKGYALKMLHKFVDKVKKEEKNVTKILLICKSDLIPLYTRAGFVLNGKSDVVHGKDTWYELEIPLQT
ncbi:hypothetical protein ACF0H5_004410 [Mactra antiquata]